jgi:hypothetical protein
MAGENERQSRISEERPGVGAVAAARVQGWVGRQRLRAPARGAGGTGRRSNEMLGRPQAHE